jgi:hypothetical protein
MSIIDSIGGRKFVGSVITSVLALVALLHGNITAELFTGLIGGSLGVFTTGNVLDKILGKKQI